MRVLSGLQSSGECHLGNYFGAIRQYVELQAKGEGIYFIADYHSMTSVRDGAERRRLVREVALDFLACGLDAERSVLYRQSDLPEVCELTWILSTVTPMGLLDRSTSYKDKISQGLSVDHGLFAYPVLMAADILIYRSDVVPVGQDQKQHLEMARDIAQRFNHAYGVEVLKLPEPHILDDVAVVPGTDGNKMSKSYDNVIRMFWPEKKLKKAVMSVVTDSTPVEDPKPTENSIILDLYKLFASAGDHDQMVADYQAGGFGYGDFKKRLWEAYWEFFAPMREKREELLADPGYVDGVLQAGADRAREEADKTLARVRKAVGLV